MMSNNQMVSPNMLGEKLIQNSSDPNPNTAPNNYNNFTHGNPFASYGSNTYTTDQTNHYVGPNLQQPTLPTQGNLGALNNIISGVGFEKLLRVQGLYLKRKYSMSDHQHALYPLDGEGTYQKGTKLFRSIEDPQSCKWTFGPHNASITFFDRTNSEIDGHSFIALEKEDVCSWNYFDRVPIKVFLTEGGQKTFIGSTARVSCCCAISYLVKDNNEDLRFLCKINRPCLGLATFDIMTPDETKVGVIKLTALTWNASRVAYSIEFPERADGLERALLIGVLMALERVDYVLKKRV